MRRRGKRNRGQDKATSDRNCLAPPENARPICSRGGPSQHLPDFIEAAIVTGLRPIEWSATGGRRWEPEQA
jgi:hypothetical protein